MSVKRAVIIILAALIIVTSFILTTMQQFNGATQDKDENSADVLATLKPGYISSDEALRLLQKDSGAIILDLRPKTNYDESHVAGAVSVPSGILEKYVSVNIQDKDQTIVVYCFCEKGGTAYTAYKLLTELGYINVFYTEPGKDWKYEGTSVH